MQIYSALHKPIRYIFETFETVDKNLIGYKDVTICFAEKNGMLTHNIFQFYKSSMDNIPT